MPAKKKAVKKAPAKRKRREPNYPKGLGDLWREFNQI